MTFKSSCIKLLNHKNPLYRKNISVISKYCTCIHLLDTYKYDTEPYMVILVETSFVKQSTYHRINYNSTIQLLFG